VNCLVTEYVFRTRIWPAAWSLQFNLQCTNDDNSSYRNVWNMSFVSFSLAVIFIMRLFNTSAFREQELDLGIFSYFSANNGGDAQEDKTEAENSAYVTILLTLAVPGYTSSRIAIKNVLNVQHTVRMTINLHGYRVQFLVSDEVMRLNLWQSS